MVASLQDGRRLFSPHGAQAPVYCPHDPRRASLCNQWDIVEMTECDLRDWVIKDTVASASYSLF